jgi:hypothetical protein
LIQRAALDKVGYKNTPENDEAIENLSGARLASAAGKRFLAHSWAKLDLLFDKENPQK